MNNFSKLAIVTAALALVAQGARAGNSEDLILGFSDSSVANDYVVDLGQTSVLNLGTGGTVDLSGDVSSSSYTSAFTSGLVTAGVVGGSSSSTGTAFMTVTSSGPGLGSVNPAATATADGGTMTSSTAKSIGSHAEGVTLGTVGNTDPASWTVNVVNFSQTQSSYNPQTGLSGTVYEDLYSTKNSSDATWNYLGYFTFNFSNPNSPTVEFTSVAVPEPATYGFMAGAGLLLVALRRQFGQKAA